MHATSRTLHGKCMAGSCTHSLLPAAQTPGHHVSMRLKARSTQLLHNATGSDPWVHSGGVHLCRCGQVHLQYMFDKEPQANQGPRSSSSNAGQVSHVPNATPPAKELGHSICCRSESSQQSQQLALGLRCCGGAPARASATCHKPHTVMPYQLSSDTSASCCSCCPRSEGRRAAAQPTSSAHKGLPWGSPNAVPAQGCNPQQRSTPTRPHAGPAARLRVLLPLPPNSKSC